jgi:hypothetical protein
MTRTWIFGVASAAALLASSALAQEGSQGTASVPDFSGVWGNPYLYGIEPPLSGPGPVGDEADLDRVGANREYDGNLRSRCLRRQCRRQRVAAIAATRRSTRSAASTGSRSYSPSPQRYSIATFCPST